MLFFLLSLRRAAVNFHTDCILCMDVPSRLRENCVDIVIIPYLQNRISFFVVYPHRLPIHLPQLLQRQRLVRLGEGGVFIRFGEDVRLARVEFPVYALDNVVAWVCMVVTLESVNNKSNSRNDFKHFRVDKLTHFGVVFSSPLYSLNHNRLFSIHPCHLSAPPNYPIS